MTRALFGSYTPVHFGIGTPFIRPYLPLLMTDGLFLPLISCRYYLVYLQYDSWRVGASYLIYYLFRSL
ncbi:hypothetical protein L210DRAFT_3591253 [Boletus edulis BED1]|uniref:Uncharacterized protein n=1 Tax=Boletus edulis BED1 TaxID=1328754 RepID=A0AAD4B9I9_BOLED|nr:hypothetical protein L210DRAFT_3591253 [Boletus edulis BED1]